MDIDIHRRLPLIARGQSRLTGTWGQAGQFGNVYGSILLE